MLEEALKQIAVEKKQQAIPKAVILNYLREYLQYLILNLIYNHKQFKKLIFKEGSCLRICYGLPRLSEDLDFDYNEEKWRFSLEEIEDFLKKEIKNKYSTSLETKLQPEKRIYLKFLFLHKLGIADKSESNKLYVKIEASNETAPKSKTKMTPIQKFGFNFIAKHYDLPSLMSGKINALLHRLWFKGKKQEVDIKGRDFYDLYWFLKNNIRPNWPMLKKMTGFTNEEMLEKALAKRIRERVTFQKLSYDLKNFIPDQEFAADFAKNYTDLISKYLK